MGITLLRLGLAAISHYLSSSTGQRHVNQLMHIGARAVHRAAVHRINSHLKTHRG